MSVASMLNLTRLGWGLAIPVLFLCIIGLACIRATDRQSGPHTTGDVEFDEPELSGWIADAAGAIGMRTGRQLVYLVSGVGLMFLMLWPGYLRVGEYAYLAYGITLALLVVLLLDRYVDLPLIPVRNNARRWIDLGLFSVQPSEFMKLALVMTLARYLRYRSTYRRWSGLLPPFLLTLVPMMLILRQPNLGTMLMLLPVLFAMLFVAGARLRHLLIIIGLAAATLPVFYFYGMKDYQRTRVQVLLQQDSRDESWQMSEGFQLRQAKIALGTGGVWGTGYGEGTFVQHDLLPEEQNDFIFAIIGHQWGLVGGILVIVAYALIVIFGMEVAMVTNDPYGRLLAVGISVMIVAQAILNICMTIGLAPISGMTLPFVSAGGSSVWTNFLGLGLLLSVAKRRPMLISRPPFEYDHEE